MKRRAEIQDTAPPHDLDAERALLGSLILKPEIMPKLVGLRPGDFHDPAHRKIFEHCLGIHAEGAPIDLALLFPRFKAHESELGCKAAAVMAELSRNCTSANWSFYLERVREVSAKRQLRFLGERSLAESANGKAPGNCIDDALSRLNEIKGSAQPESKLLTYRRFTCSELAAAEFTIEYLVQGMLVAGQPCIMSGGKKSLKTSVAIDLAISLAMAGHFLGRFKVTRGCRVLIMSGESGLATIQETAFRIAAAAGRHLTDISSLIISDELPMLGNADHAEALPQDAHRRRNRGADSGPNISVPQSQRRRSEFVCNGSIVARHRGIVSIGWRDADSDSSYEKRRCRSVRATGVRRYRLGRFSRVCASTDFASGAASDTNREPASTSFGCLLAVLPGIRRYGR